MKNEMDFGQANFLNLDICKKVVKQFGSPIYIYSEKELEKRADEFLNFPSAFGKDIRYAMKANPNMNILSLFNKKGIKIDASSEYEAFRAIDAGVLPDNISLSTQELPNELEELLKQGVFINATSLSQIEAIGKLKPGIKIGVRINPGTGDGAFKAISTGGTTSGFGIWHEKISEVQKLAQSYDLKISKIHIHIGSENTPESWVNSASIGLEIVEQFKDVNILDMGGGFKMAIMPYEQKADLIAIGNAVAIKFREFEQKTGRKIHLEVEPGKYLVINSCSVICKVVDIMDTGKDGYNFIRVNSGMTEMPRVPMYGIQEPIYIMNKEKRKENYVMIGHCCESGDLLTCKLYEQETIEPRILNKAHIGDLVVIDGVGAYNSSMSMKNYNSFPEAGEVLLRKDGRIVEIRKRQKIEDIWKNEIEVL